MSSARREWYKRGYLPHRDRGGLYQVITYRLADSLPENALNRIEEKLRTVNSGEIEIERRKELEAWLDAGHGNCVLQHPQAAECVVDTWRKFNRERYDLIAWVVMPNHVHVLIRTYEDVALGRIVQSWKSYTGRRISEMFFHPGASGNAEPQLGSQGAAEKTRTSRAGARRSQRVWMREYWDRYIRDEKHFRAALDYIHSNPVKAGLVSQPEDWPWSSAREKTV